MKKIISNLFVLSIILVFVSCKKDANDVVTPQPQTVFTIAATKTQGIKKDESVTFNTDPVIKDSVTWTVSPSAGVDVNTGGSKAVIVFNKAGSYVVSAKSGTLTVSKNVSVVDSTLADVLNQPLYALKSLDAADEIKLSLDANTLGQNTYVDIEAITTKSYSCVNNLLKDSLNPSTSINRELFYQGVLTPNAQNCSGGQAPAKTLLRTMKIKDNDIHGFFVYLNGKKYTGSFVRSANGEVTFTWPYTSGVTISPLVLPK